jgi:hypothetical protein
MHYNDEIEEIKDRTRKENELKKLWRAEQRKKGEINLYAMHDVERRSNL